MLCQVRPYLNCLAWDSEELVEAVRSNSLAFGIFLCIWIFR